MWSQRVRPADLIIHKVGFLSQWATLKQHSCVEIFEVSLYLSYPQPHHHNCWLLHTEKKKRTGRSAGLWSLRKCSSQRTLIFLPSGTAGTGLWWRGNQKWSKATGGSVMWHHGFRPVLWYTRVCKIFEARRMDRHRRTLMKEKLKALFECIACF